MITIPYILNFIKENWQKMLAVLLVVLLGYFWWKVESLKDQADDARVDAQNQIAELSRVVRESNGAYSRLAQQAESSSSILATLQERNQQLASIIEQRDEQILQLTTAIGHIRPVNVVVRPNEISQTVIPSEENPEIIRRRVDFDTTHEDYLRISGFTLTDPAEANVSVQYTRPINFTVATTQSEDGSWRTYIESDLPDLQIGQIESRVNPIQIRSTVRRIEQEIELGIGSIVSTNGNSGALYAIAGYDFGAIQVSVNAGGILSTSGLDFGVGGEVLIAPFDL